MRRRYCLRCNVTDASRYYDSEASECKLCEGRVVAPVLIGIALLVSAVGLALACARYKACRLPPGIRLLGRKVRRRLAQLSVKAKCKQLLGFYQVATRISQVPHSRNVMRPSRLEASSRRPPLSRFTWSRCRTLWQSCFQSLMFSTSASTASACRCSA